jgi:hypothetical protein
MNLTMVQPTLEKNNNDRTNAIDDVPMWMHDEDATEMAGKNREENDQEEHEFLVKWQMPKEYTTTDAKKQMIKLLAVLMMSFSDVTFIDRKQREWSFTAQDEEERFCKELQAAAIQVHSIKNKQTRVVRWIAITKIRATTNIPDWKTTTSSAMNSSKRRHICSLTRLDMTNGKLQASDSSRTFMQSISPRDTSIIFYRNTSKCRTVTHQPSS